eukprot:jgi/Botrbrau1/15538/Bobra.0333s0004.2
MALSGYRSGYRLAIIIAGFILIISGAESSGRHGLQGRLRKLLQSDEGRKAPTITMVVYEDVDQGSAASGTDGSRGDPAGASYHMVRQLSEVYEGAPAPAPRAAKESAGGEYEPKAQQSAAEVYEGAPAPAPRIEKQSADGEYEPKAQQSAAEVYESAPAPAPKIEKQSADSEYEPTAPKARQSTMVVYEGAPAPAPRVEKESGDGEYEPTAQQSAGEVYESAPVSPAKAPAPGKGFY